MTSPVIAALANARAAEVIGGLKERDTEIAAMVFHEIEPPVVKDASLPASFVRWCEDRQVSALPARPCTVALYVLQNRHVGLSDLVELVDQIGAAHVATGMADPTTTYPVPAMLNKIAAINPPRSWPKEEKQRFLALPYSLQTYVCKREGERDRAVRQAQNEAADVRKKIEGKKDDPETKNAA
jgi:hypothetical protein